MNAKKILILGAGAAGSIVANKIARELRRDLAKGKLEVTVLDKDDLNTNQGGFTFVPFGLYAPEDITRPRSRLISPRVKTAFGADGEVNRVDLGNREVTTKSGRKYSYDYLLISTGCRLEPEAVPGLSGDLNTFYTLEGAMKLREALKTLNKGRIVILTPEMPIACPGAPSKFTILLDDYLRHMRGEDVRKDVEISFLWPIGNIGPAVYNEKIVEAFAEREIEYRKEFKVQEVDSDEKVVISADGYRVGYDLLVSIPPHRGIKALQESGITDENGWVPTDIHTLQYSKSPSESYDEVYAVGDAGSAKINKMGITAHFQALTAGQNLINDYLGNGVRVMYNGEQGCPIVESSYTPATDGRAYLVTWTYGNPPGPFNSTKLGWLIYRMYYYIYWDTTIKAIM